MTDKDPSIEDGRTITEWETPRVAPKPKDSPKPPGGKPSEDKPAEKS